MTVASIFCSPHETQKLILASTVPVVYQVANLNNSTYELALMKRYLMLFGTVPGEHLQKYRIFTRSNRGIKLPSSVVDNS